MYGGCEDQSEQGDRNDRWNSFRKSHTTSPTFEEKFVILVDGNGTEQ